MKLLRVSNFLNFTHTLYSTGHTKALHINRMTQFTLQHWRNLLTCSYDRRNSPEAAMEEGTMDSPKNRRKNNPPPPFSPSDLEGVARFLDTDPDYWIFRRFGKLHLFNLLRIQLDLVRLEHKLDMQISGDEEKDFGTLLPHIQSSLSEYGMLHNHLTFLSYTPLQLNMPRARWINKLCLSLDAALSALAKSKSYREPDRNIVSQLTDWATTTIENGQPLLQGLEIPYPGNACLRDLASIAAIQKSWTHRFIDKYDCLRRIFVRLPTPITSQINSYMWA